MNKLTAIDNICLITECNNKIFPHARVLISTFVERNDWFDGTIVILTLESDPLSDHNINTINLIYDDIQIVKVSDSEISELKAKVEKRKYYEDIFDYLKIYAFKIKSKGNIYLSNKVVVLSQLSSIVTDDAVSMSTTSDLFPNIGTSLSTNMMFVPECNISDIIFEDLYNELIHSILNGTDAYLTEFINNRFEINRLTSNILVESSIFPSNRYSNFVRYSKSINAIHIPRSILSNAKYARVQIYLNQHMTRINNNANRPSKVPRKVIHPKTIHRNPAPTAGIVESDISISVIIPAYKAENYIQECIDSIVNQNTTANIEILIGIDNCLSTLHKLNEIKSRYSNLKIFTTSESVGPYIIRNSLLDFAKYDNILFFDADDIMKSTMISTILKYYSKTRPIRFRYLNFRHADGYSNNSPHYDIAHGVFFAKKDIIDRLGGFMPWKCGADTEFIKRCTHNRIQETRLNDCVFYRRIHGNSLTQNTATNHRSKIRDIAKQYIKTNKDWSIPIQTVTTNLTLVP